MFLVFILFHLFFIIFSFAAYNKKSIISITPKYYTDMYSWFFFMHNVVKLNELHCSLHSYSHPLLFIFFFYFFLLCECIFYVYVLISFYIFLSKKICFSTWKKIRLKIASTFTYFSFFGSCYCKYF